MAEMLSLDPLITERFRSLHRLVGNTPLLAIDFTWRGEPRVIYAKHESLNLTGSIKDRMALFILEQAYRSGRIKPGDPIAEATSGNTGISFAAIGRSLGHPVTIFMPDWLSHERLALIASLGAAIVPVSRDEGGFIGCIRRAEELGARDPSVFLPRQFANEANVGAHEQTTGREILLQLGASGLTPDAFVAGVGTGGTVMGVSRAFGQQHPHVAVHPLEPRESPTLSTGYKIGHHRIQGISDEFVPPIVNLRELSSIVAISDGDAILMSQKLARCGLAVGISSGANFLGAVQVQNTLQSTATVVTVFADSNKKYLSTDLLRPEAVKEGYLSPDVTIVGFRSLSRVCDLCMR